MINPWVEPSSRRQETLRSGLVIDYTKRLNNSQSGNPRIRVTFTDGSVHQTSDDASVSYQVENHVTDRSISGKPVDIVLTRAGRIIYMRLSEGSSINA